MNLWDKIKLKWLSTRMGKWCKEYIGWDDYLAFFILLLGVLGYIVGLTPNMSGWGAFYFDIRSELIGIGVSVLIIANAGQWISREQEKKRLILQMGSPDNAFALEATRQLEDWGWLLDGSLIGANLYRADLRKANLYRANMSRAELAKADLRGHSWVMPT